MSARLGMGRRMAESVAQDACCEHGALDHGNGTNGSAKVGDPCSIPGCECKGYRKRGRTRPVEVADAR